MCVCVDKLDGRVCMFATTGMYMEACVYCYISVKCDLSGDVCVCVFMSVDVHLPLVVFSAHEERSGLSAQTLSHSTSETHILSDRKRQRTRKREGESNGRKGQSTALIFVILYLCLCQPGLRAKREIVTKKSNVFVHVHGHKLSLFFKTVGTTLKVMFF